MPPNAYCLQPLPHLLGLPPLWQIFPSMDGPNISIFCWNVRGLNTQARKDAVRETLTSTTSHLACLQETKLTQVDQSLADFLGGPNLRSFAFKPDEGTRGGILLLWNDDFIEVTNVLQSTYNLSASVTLRECNSAFRLTIAYGPS